MSTKTTFKRVALVAVAALGLGVMSVAPSNAAAQLDSLAVSLASTTQNTTETLTATASVLTATLAGTKGVDTLTVTASIVSGPAYVQPVLAFKESTTAVASTTADSSVQTVTPNDTNTVSQATAKYNVYLKAPTVVGTYVVKITPTGGTNAAAVTVSIVVSAKVIQGPSATNSKLYLEVTNDNYNANVSYDGGGNAYAHVYGSGPSASYLADTYTVAVASSPIGTLMGNLAIVPAGAAAGAFKRTPITIAISGPGYVAFSPTAARAKSVTEAKDISVAYDPFDPANQSASAYVWSSGEGGVATITATMDGVLLGTRKVSFIGTTKSYVFGTPTKSVIGVGASETGSVTVTGADDLGTSTGAASVYAFSSDTTVATVNNTQASTVVITGVKSGTATITVGNASTIATSTITKTLAIKVGAVTAKTVALSFDNATPAPGEKVTVTVTATDASGNPVGDGARRLFSSAGITTSLSTQGASWTAVETVTVIGGKATYTFYAPTGTGSLTLSATEGTDTDSTTKGTITGSVSVTNAALDAAQMAAEEATAAAQDATDAALGAAEAAEAAGALAQEAVDLVTELSANVTKLISDLKAQITTLTNLVIKIQKKVGAK